MRTEKNKVSEDYLGREFVIAREFDAPRELVFKGMGLIPSTWSNGGDRAVLRILFANGMRSPARLSTLSCVGPTELIIRWAASFVKSSRLNGWFLRAAPWMKKERYCF